MLEFGLLHRCTVKSLLPWGYMGLALLLVLWTLITKPTYPNTNLIATNTQVSEVKAATPLWQWGALNHLPTPSVHAFQFIRTPQALHGVWYGGTAEGEPDVQLYWATFNPINQAWSKPRAILNRYKVTQDTGRLVLKVGNATGIYAQGRIYLFFVTVGLGGWAASSLNMMTSEDEGRSWSQVKRLLTSPMLNVSHLVRGPVQQLEDGNFWIPAYFEGPTKYSVMIKVSPQGKVLGWTNVTTASFEAIQPHVLQNDQVQYFYSRHMVRGGRMVQTTRNLATEDVTIQLGQLRNADSALAVTWLNAQTAIMAYNNTPKDRKNIDLAISNDKGRTWQHLLTLEKVKESGLGYPALSCAPMHGDWQCDLVYTVQRKYFRHIRFNEAGLWQQIHKGEG